MILRTLDRARGCKLLDEIWVATDCSEIKNIVEDDGGYAVMTNENCETGTDRIVEALKRQGFNTTDSDDPAREPFFPWDAVVNIQGDEPLLPSSNVDLCIQHFFHEDNNIDIATLVTPIRTLKDFEDKNVVKCVVDENGYLQALAVCEQVREAGGLSGA